VGGEAGGGEAFCTVGRGRNKKRLQLVQELEVIQEHSRWVGKSAYHGKGGGRCAMGAKGCHQEETANCYKERTFLKSDPPADLRQAHRRRLFVVWGRVDKERSLLEILESIRHQEIAR